MTYKKRKRGGGRFVQISEMMQATEAWATLKPGPRALYIELKRRYNGRNNGQILMSCREAADLINVHRNTIPGYLAELQARGFVREVRRGYLGAGGHGIASSWLLCELASADGKAALMTFRTWRGKQEPVTNIVPIRHSRRAGA